VAENIEESRAPLIEHLIELRQRLVYSTIAVIIAIGAGGEIQLTDAMASTIGSVPFHAVRFDGARFDCGDKAGYLAANIAYALQRDDIGPKLVDLIPQLKDFVLKEC